MKRFGHLLAMLTAANLVAHAAPQDLAPQLAEVRSHHKLPALACAVVRSNAIIAHGVVGERQAGDPTPAGIGDVWHHGSVTKSMTATLAALLVEDGRIAWTNTLADVFPANATEMDPAWRGVTLELLLGHRGGAPDEDWLDKNGLWQAFWTNSGTPREQRRFLRTAVTSKPPQNPPGTKFVYSNTGYIIAGAMLEERTGRAWEELITERLFRPLKMESAGFGPPGSPDKVDQPRGHLIEGLFFKRLQPVAPGPQADNPPGLGPAGTVHCSLDDLANYIMAHIGGELGRETPLKLRPDSWHKLHTALPGQDYALGWNVASRPWAGGKALNHTGSNTMWFSNVWLAPQRDFAVIILTNVGDDDAFKATDEVAGEMIRKYLP
jgi:CubicO group peptidase (beta-lactamase class C family)